MFPSIHDGQCSRLVIGNGCWAALNQGLIFELLEIVSQKLTQWLFALEPHRLHVKPEMQSREMAQPLKVPSAKPDYQSLMPGTHTVRGKDLWKLFSDCHWHRGTCGHPSHPHNTQIKTTASISWIKSAWVLSSWWWKIQNNPALVQNYV